MECTEIIEKYLNGLKNDFYCVQVNEKLKIITPYVYPDNDLIEIFIEDLKAGLVKVTDMGEGFRHLHSQGYDVFSSPKRAFLADTIASRLGVEISKGKLIKTVEWVSLYEAMFDVITAVRGIADLIYTSKTYAPGEFIDEVRTFLDEKKIKYENKVRIQGISTKLYSIDFQITNGRISYLQTLSPRDVYGVKTKVDATVRMWVDVNSDKKKYSLLNDIDFTWKGSDVSILNRVSNAAFWSRKEELVLLIA